MGLKPIILIQPTNLNKNGDLQTIIIIINMKLTTKTHIQKEILPELNSNNPKIDKHPKNITKREKNPQNQKE